MGRLHRRHAGAVVAFAALVLVHEFIAAMTAALTPVNTISGEDGLPYPVLFVSVYTLLPPLSIVIGAIGGLGRSGAAAATRQCRSHVVPTSGHGPPE